MSAIPTLVAGAERAAIQNLSYWFPGNVDPALSHVNFTVSDGLTAVAGPSGSGKSTLLRVLNGLVPHFHGGRVRGRLVVAGRDASRESPRSLAREVGFVFQDPETQMVRGVVEDEVAFALENMATPPSAISTRVEAAMAAVGILHLGGRAVASLSGGERQRVAIASAVALGPGILALDEPTSQLDPEGAATVVAVCGGLARGGTAVVVSEHRIAGLLAVADRLAVVRAGQVEGPGPVRQMLDRLADPPAFVELALRLGLVPLPRELSEIAPPTLREVPTAAGKTFGDVAWHLRECTLGHHRRPVVSAADMAGGAGQVTVLMGPNGAGKTTVLRAIAGLQAPLSGTAWRRPGRVAYLPQDPGVLLHRQTVRAEVEYTLGSAGSAESPKRILDRLHLTVLADRYPGDLSSGQRQRAALAAILAGCPGLVLLDEPTRGMDREARRALVALLQEMAAAGSSVVLATHDAELAAAVADQVLLVDSGEVRDAGTPASALSGANPFATDMGRLYPGGPVTLEEVLSRL
ncbi:MAG: ATP-binding cassette domain-containing protein [Candidatus Dormibacteria bacterium]